MTLTERLPEMKVMSGLFSDRNGDIFRENGLLFVKDLNVFFRDRMEGELGYIDNLAEVIISFLSSQS